MDQTSSPRRTQSAPLTIDEFTVLFGTFWFQLGTYGKALDQARVDAYWQKIGPCQFDTADIIDGFDAMLRDEHKICPQVDIMIKYFREAKHRRTMFEVQRDAANPRSPDEKKRVHDYAGEICRGTAAILRGPGDTAYKNGLIENMITNLRTKYGFDSP